MKNIILDCDLMKHPNSGLYHYCLNLGNYVSELLTDQKESMNFYVPEAEKNTFANPGGCIVERNYHRFYKPFLRKCNIWHVPFQAGRLLPDKKKHKRTRVLLTIHDLNPLHEGKSKPQQLRSLAQTQALIDRSNAIVCISEFTRKDVLENCDVGDKPVYVVHNGTHKVHPGSLENASYKPARPFLFGMGYVNTKKNFHVLLPLLKDESLELLVAGRLDEPDYIGKMTKLANELGVGDRFRLLGPVTEQEKGWYLENCLAYVHPSLAEGFGAPVVEAMQFGKPLFLSALTSLPEIGGDAAFYFSSFNDEQMRGVFAEGMKKYRETQMSDLIRERGSRFDWRINARQYLKIYRSLY